MRRPILAFATALLLGLVMPAKAHPLDTDFPAEQFLAVQAESAFAQQRLFEMNQLAAPLCPRYLSWQLGPGLQMISAAPLGYKRADARREVLLKAFPDTQGSELLLIQEIPGTPLARAGLQRGDRLRALEIKDSQEKLPGMFGMKDYLERKRQESNERYSKDPRDRLLRLRGTQSEPIELERVPACGFSFDVLSDGRLFAYASWSRVLITRTLLQRLSAEEQTLAVAYELAHILSGFTELNSMVLSGDAIGAALGVGGGTIRYSPEASMLIEIDRLAMMLVEGYGLGPKQFRRFLEQRETERNGIFGGPSYVRLREPSAERLKALDELAAARAAGYPWERPRYIDHDLFEAFVQALPAARERLGLR